MGRSITSVDGRSARPAGFWSGSAWSGEREGGRPDRRRAEQTRVRSPAPPPKPSELKRFFVAIGRADHGGRRSTRSRALRERQNLAFNFTLDKLNRGFYAPRAFV